LAFISLLLVGLLAVGAMVALADKGGPGHGVDHGVATGLQDDGAAAGSEVAQQSNGDPDLGQEKIAQAIADAFDVDGGVGVASVDASSVTTLHDQGIGYGAIFKLHAIAAAKGVTVDTLLADIEVTPEGEYKFAFGKLIKGLEDNEAEAAAFESGPKNLGQLVSAANKDKKDKSKGASSDGGS
jgi:hypothetical protein